MRSKDLEIVNEDDEEEDDEEEEAVEITGF